MSEKQKLMNLATDLMIIGCNSLCDSGETESCPFDDSESICGDCLLHEAINVIMDEFR